MAPRILITWIALDGMGSAFALPAEQDQRKAMIAGIDHAPSVLSELGGFETRDFYLRVSGPADPAR